MSPCRREPVEQRRSSGPTLQGLTLWWELLRAIHPRNDMRRASHRAPHRIRIGIRDTSARAAVLLPKITVMA